MHKSWRATGASDLPLHSWISLPSRQNSSVYRGSFKPFFLFKPFVRCTLGSSGRNKIKQNLSFAQNAASGSCRKVRSPSPAPLHLQETLCFHTFCAIQEFWPLKASRALPGMGQEGAFCTKWLGSLTQNLGEDGGCLHSVRQPSIEAVKGGWRGILGQHHGPNVLKYQLRHQV